MWRFDFINHLIKSRGYTSYLEIGLADCNKNFNQIKCEHKSGVDRKTLEDLVNVESNKRIKLYAPCTSDTFFKKYIERNYDIIFVDGSHKEADVDKDIDNSLKHLNEGGVIIIHDCMPPEWDMAQEKPMHGRWCGTVWRSIVKIRCSRNDLELNIVDCDLGCGILEKGEQEVYKAHSLERCLDWGFFNKNKNDIFNIISTEEFFNIYK
jgi:hypothetical protein